MRSIKFILTTLSIVTLLGVSSCKEDCVAPDIADNLIGTWETVLVPGEVEFRTDGTYRDDNAVLLGVNDNLPDDVRDYVLTGDQLELHVAAADGSAEVWATYTVSQNECDQIKLTIIGITETLNRVD